MTLTTRKPTGRASWPFLLIAGAEKAGKSWSCATASASPLIGRTLWVGIGEDDPDEYGTIPGADFDIVEHDGTYPGILHAINDAVREPQGDRPTLVVVDSMTRLWDLLCDEAQETANRRAIAKARRFNKPVPDEDVQITMDLWNVAKSKWGHVMDTLRAHTGPVIATARLEQVTVMDANGKPTTEKAWKVKAEKSLPFDVTGSVHMPTRGEAYLEGVRSARMQLAKRTQVRDFTVEGLWRDLGVAEGNLGPRTHATVRTEGAAAGPQQETAVTPPAPPRQAPNPATEARKRLAAWLDEEGIHRSEAAQRFRDEYDGKGLADGTAEQVEEFIILWQGEVARRKASAASVPVDADDVVEAEQGTLAVDGDDA